MVGIIRGAAPGNRRSAAEQGLPYFLVGDGRNQVPWELACRRAGRAGHSGG